MCGIAGIVNFKEKIKPDSRPMIKLIRHRGPDAEGYFSNDNVSLGHARLRILDLDKRADQPMFDTKRKIVVVFNGEIYNFKEIKKNIHNYNFTTDCDTEIIIASYKKWGTKCVNYFVGMFSFILYDISKNLIFGARDRFGIKPFFYSYNNNTFSFGSEIKALKPVLNKFTLNINSAYKYLLDINFENEEDTFFNDVFQLKPGHTIVFNGEKLKIEKYYDLKSKIITNNNIDFGEIPNLVRYTLNKSVKRRTLSDVPIGLFFSGGLDSSCIAASLKDQHLATQVQSFTYISDNVPLKEKNLIKKMSQDLNLKNELVSSDENNNNDLHRRLMWHMETPYSAALILDDKLNSIAKEKGLTVVLEGQGSDEINAGYKHYLVPYFIDSLRKYNLKNCFQAYVKGSSEFKESFLQKLVTDSLKFLLPRNFIKNFSNNKHQLTKYFKRQSININFRNSLEVEYDNNITLLQNAMFSDFNSKLLRVLRNKDRISMSYGRELRVPFLDHELVELSFSINDNLKIKEGRQKNLIIEAYKDILPEETYTISKNNLLRSKLQSIKRKNLVNNTYQLLNKEIFFDRKLFPEDLYSDLKSKKFYDKSILWRMSQIELLNQTFIDS